MIRVQHTAGESFVLYDQGAGKQLAGPGTRGQMEEQRRKLIFSALPILPGYLAAVLEDAEHSESDDACSASREARDVGTIYDCPEDVFEPCRASCERFSREQAEHIAAALELEPGRYGGSGFDSELIGHCFYMMRVGHGVGFTDNYTPGAPACLEALATAARDFGYMEGAIFDDADGRVYLIGGEA